MNLSLDILDIAEDVFDTSLTNGTSGKHGAIAPTTELVEGSSVFGKAVNTSTSPKPHRGSRGKKTYQGRPLVARTDIWNKELCAYIVPSGMDVFTGVAYAPKRKFECHVANDAYSIECADGNAILIFVAKEHKLGDLTGKIVVLGNFNTINATRGCSILSIK